MKIDTHPFVIPVASQTSRVLEPQAGASTAQQYVLALKSVKKSDLNGLESSLSESNLSQLQLSELLFHAAQLSDHRLAEKLLEYGASLAFDDYRAWHIAIHFGNYSVINCFRARMKIKHEEGDRLHVIV